MKKKVCAAILGIGLLAVITGIAVVQMKRQAQAVPYENPGTVVVLDDTIPESTLTETVPDETTPTETAPPETTLPETGQEPYITAEAAHEILRKDITFWMVDVLGAEVELWFEAYNGEQWQTIEADTWYNTPIGCDDIIYYQPEQECAPEAAAKEMVNLLLSRMMEPSQLRPFTITDYRVPEQTIHTMEQGLDLFEKSYNPQEDGALEEAFMLWAKSALMIGDFVPVEENMWYIVPKAYYKYDGVCGPGITMEQAMEAEPELAKDGYIPFVAEGSGDLYQFILIKNGPVYRLQRLSGMHALYKNQPEIVE